MFQEGIILFTKMSVILHWLNICKINLSWLTILEPVDRQEVRSRLLERNFLTDDNAAVVFKDEGKDLKLTGG